MSKRSDDTEQSSNFRPRARIMRTLGEELISSETVAIIELVKNAYDADASRILVRFRGTLEKGKGTVEVIDDGTGMSIDTIRTVWMEPATPTKRQRRQSEKLKRRVLGEKGIGRFASSRLADELEVVTRRATAKKEVYSLFDWTQFDNEELYLDEILILSEERTPVDICPGGAIQALWETKEHPKTVDLTHGTLLRMTKLKQSWGKEQFGRLRRGLARLIRPSTDQPDFQISLDLPPEYQEYASVVEPPALLKYPHYSIKGRVEKDGRYTFTARVFSEGTHKQVTGQFIREAGKTTGRLMKVSRETPGKKHRRDEASTPQCGPLDIELRVWDRDELGNIEQKTRSSLLDIRRDLDAIAGINIFRDGFRVLPYGEPNDDWLRLDLRRVQNPTLRLSNNQIVGSISITADENPGLKDQSNREGLEEGPPLADLREIMLAVLHDIEEARYKARPHRESTSRTPVGSLFSAMSLQPLRDHMAKVLAYDPAASKVIDETETSIKKQLQEIQTVLGRYQRLATLGQLIDVVLHDGRQPVASIINEAELGIDDIERSNTASDAIFKVLKGRLGNVYKQGDVLRTAFRRIEPFGGRRRGRPAQLYLEQIVHDAFAVFESEIKDSKVKVTLPHTETLVRVDQAELQEVLVNLIQNSLYWLAQAEDDKREILVRVQRTAQDQVEIVFSDSGPGVPADNKDRIFEPYFSTKPDGVGLGLSIAGEIVSDYYAGTLELLDAGPLPGATFRIILRRRV